MPVAGPFVVISSFLISDPAFNECLVANDFPKIETYTISVRKRK